MSQIASKWPQSELQLDEIEEGPLSERLFLAILGEIHHNSVHEIHSGGMKVLWTRHFGR